MTQESECFRNEKDFALNMGLDLLLFQADKDGEPELIKASQRARFASEEIVDQIQEEYKEWTRGKSIQALFTENVLVKYEVDQNNKEINSTQKEIGKILKVRNVHNRQHWLIFQAKGDAKELVAKKSQLEQKKKDIQLDADRRKEQLDKKVRSVGNIVDKSVPISNTEVNSLPNHQFI